MAKAEWIARQSRLPSGIVGRVVAKVMALDTASTNQQAVERLGLEPDDRVLELGCGHGRTLGLLADRVPEGRVVGVDPSSVMRTEAERRNARRGIAGLVTVSEGAAEAIPHEAGLFDAALTVHTLYFWADLDAGLSELHRVLRAGGRLLIAFRPRDDEAAVRLLPDSVYDLRSVAEVEDALARAGFQDVQTDLEKNPKSLLAWTAAVA